MMSIRDPAEYALALGLLLSGDVKRQDVGSAFAAGAYNPFVRRLTLSWLKININKLRQLYHCHWNAFQGDGGRNTVPGPRSRG